MLFTLFLLPLLTCLQYATAHGSRDTNAQRLAKRLPLLPPRKFGRQTPGRPSTVERARRSSTSATPSQGGFLVAYDSNSGQKLGCITVTYPQGTWASYQISASATAATCMPINLPTDSTGPFGIAFTTPHDSTNLYLGQTTQFGPGKQCSTCAEKYNELVGTNQLSSTIVYSANSFDQATNRAPDPTESLMWLYDPNTSVLTSQWTNTDGSITPLYTFRFLPQYGNIYFGANLAAWQASARPHGGEIQIVLKYASTY